jgi:retron-type reverse transcriptase
MQTDLFQNEERLFEKLCEPFWLGLGFSDVKKNRGAPGIDGITIEDFSDNLEVELTQLSQDIESWDYKPQPVRRVEIDKPDGGIRLLGIRYC